MAWLNLTRQELADRAQIGLSPDSQAAAAVRWSLPHRCVSVCIGGANLPASGWRVASLPANTPCTRNPAAADAEQSGTLGASRLRWTANTRQDPMHQFRISRGDAQSPPAPNETLVRQRGEGPTPGRVRQDLAGCAIGGGRRISRVPAVPSTPEAVARPAPPQSHPWRNETMVRRAWRRFSG